MATRRQKAKTRATSPKRDKLVRKRKPSKSDNPRSAVTRLKAELREALEQQTATAEVLQVINSSPSNLTPVFDAMLERALRLCEAPCGHFRTFDGEQLYLVAARGVPDAYTEFIRPTPVRSSSENQLGRILRGQQVVVSVDTADEEAYRAGDSLRRAFVDLGGARSAVTVALAKDKKLLGTLTVYRQEVRPFSDKQIALLQNFAAQAVIAMDNARLLNELRQRTDDLTESLEYQTATSELLEVISRSASDIRPVFETIMAAAKQLCDAESGGVAVRSGNDFRYVLTRQTAPEPDAMLMAHNFTVDRSTVIGRTALEGQVVQVVDVTQDPEFDTIVGVGGVRTLLGVPLVQNDQVIGVIVLRRRKVEAFSERQIALVKTFADQAVIAMENARLLGELLHGFSPEEEKGVRSKYPVRPDDWSVLSARVVATGQAQHSDDILADEHYDHDHMSRAYRRMFGVPILREGKPIGAITVGWREQGTTPQAQVDLLTTFAAQAVIAIENTRLFTELRQRTDDLTESLEYQTATSELLEVITRSAANIQPVIDTMLVSAARLCATHFGTVAVRQGDVFRRLGVLGYTPEVEQALRSQPVKPGRDSVSGRVLLERQVVHIADLAADPEFVVPQLVRFDDLRTTLGVPLMRDGAPIGVIAVSRNRVEPFTERQISLLRTFADQAVIAMENARLLSELRERTDDLTESLEYQTATSELLEVISRSTTDVQPVLDTMLASAARLCGTNSEQLSPQSHRAER